MKAKRKSALPGEGLKIKQNAVGKMVAHRNGSMGATHSLSLMLKLKIKTMLGGWEKLWF